MKAAIDAADASFVTLMPCRWNAARPMLHRRWVPRPGRFCTGCGGGAPPVFRRSPCVQHRITPPGAAVPRNEIAFLCYRLLPMEQDAASSAGVLPAPRVIGRTLRIVVGAALLYFFVELIREAPQILAARSGWSVPRGSWW